MALPGMIVVKEEMDRIDAENVAALLKGQGIAALITADDAGGAMPGLSGVRVLVGEEDAERARQVLGDATADDVSAADVGDLGDAEFED